MRPERDNELMQITEAALASAAARAGDLLACKPGCDACCHGAFAINALDASRLQAGFSLLEKEHPSLAATVRARAEAWIADNGAEFPGDAATGVLGTSDEDQDKFEDFANDPACPVLDPATGRCDLYAWRPMTCRVFGPPVRNEGDALGCCELCFVDAAPEEMLACEMHLPTALEEELLAETGDERQTVIAYALTRFRAR
jgi:Fe-S-cluster containining protein